MQRKNEFDKRRLLLAKRTLAKKTLHDLMQIGIFSILISLIYFIFFFYYGQEFLHYVTKILRFVTLTVTIFLVLLLIKNWGKIRVEQKAKKKVVQFKKNLTYIIRDEYGFVTEQNLDEVRTVAATMYTISIGDFNFPITKQNPEFFNEIILTKSEYLAVYGKVITQGNTIVCL